MDVPEPGAEVQVPWGLDMLLGTVQRTYDTGRGPQAVVRVHVPGVSGSSVDDVTVTLPVSALEPVPESGGPEEAAGSWVSGLAYERQVFPQLEAVLLDIDPTGETRVAIEGLEPGHDFYVYRMLPNSPTFNILCLGVIKYTQKKSFPISRVQEELRKFRGMVEPVLLVANADVAPQGKKIMESSDLKVVWQKWRNESDNLELKETLASLLR
ncbi:hypothetical protein [Streptomyces zingiberis]|uniref:Uncharacterized protein n=1 Tax=Streptomyces zingiberis TaxID=2053010 RepID=A0ABX1BSC0_9ACTN|nr:hypothetical protein [Streptomyces zingiberis]NJP99352.1 hypothetical protein [Streptomyces zingiberis]